jgi:L-rhamnose mutarotase
MTATANNCRRFAMPRLCFALDLIDEPGSIAAYEALHQPGSVWPEIINDICAEGYQSMQIWRTGNRLFMITETAEDFPHGTRNAAMAEIYDRWQATMDKFQRRLPHAQADQKWVPMGCIFDLDQHAGSASGENQAVRSACTPPTAV